MVDVRVDVGCRIDDSLGACNTGGRLDDGGSSQCFGVCPANTNALSTKQSAEDHIRASPRLGYFCHPSVDPNKSKRPPQAGGGVAMSALLLRWLNDELKLRRKVEVLERDASSGYIIAEVLYLNGLEPQFETYENSSSTAAKIHNMELLGQKFEALGVPFPVNTRRAIMMEDRSAVLQFLLQLKDFLRRRLKGRPDSAKAKVAVPEQSAKAVPAAAKSNLPPRDVEERFVAATMQKFHPTEVRFLKDIDMAVHLRKFEQAQWQAENELDDVRAKVYERSTMVSWAPLD